MARVWTDITTADENAYHGGIMFDTERRSWDEAEVDHQLNPSNHIFVTKTGLYQFDGGRTVLYSGARRVGVLEGFNPDTAHDGDNRQGLSDESPISVAQ